MRQETVTKPSLKYKFSSGQPGMTHDSSDSFNSYEMKIFVKLYLIIDFAKMNLLVGLYH